MSFLIHQQQNGDEMKTKYDDDIHVVSIRRIVIFARYRQCTLRGGQNLIIPKPFSVESQRNFVSRKVDRL